MDVNQEEKKIIEFWKKDKTFEKSLAKTKKGKPYIFYDGPPFATGLPHYGHILASTIKDAIPRFWTMKGRYVKRVWGWDCHGLPIENIAEKELGIKTKDEIEKMGVGKFNAFCRSKVLTYASEWGKAVERIARWVDFDNSYKTMDNNYIESVWWAFKQLYEKGFIYKGEKVLMYCTRCGTPIASSEIAMDQSYKTVKEDTITVKFKIKNENAFFLAWTTTPWTLPSNLALTVNPNLKYAYVKDTSDNSVYVLGKEAIPRYFKNLEEYKIIKEIDGEELKGKKYEPLFPYFEHLKNSFRVIPGDFVNADDGTGIVHTAPAFGEDDYNACKDNGIDFIQPVDKSGKFTNEVVDFAGVYIKDADAKIIEFLKKQGKVVKIEKKAHEYPFCYRCETPLMYRAIPSWFVNIQKIKNRMLKLNEKMNWYPENLKFGRFKNNIENAPDWTISRNRYWASAIPVWECEKCKEIKVIGSIEELKKNALNLKGKVDLHKDYLDNVKMKCKCGNEMKRIPEVLDCWFESGAMPFAQFHYPFENKKYFEENFPAEFVAEYIAQTRAWFYYCLVMSSILFDDIPYKNVVTTGTILAENGDKMSKSKGNFPDPWKLFEKYGVDSIRFYLLSSVVMNAESVNFSEKSVDEIYKKVLMLLYNVNNFYSQNKGGKIEKPVAKHIMDKWVLSRLNEFLMGVTQAFESYNTVLACNEIKKFVDDLSTWYVRRSRDRFNENDKNAVKTLGWVLQETAKAIAPIMPFVSEFIYSNVSGKKDSVHVQSWPDYDKKKIDNKLMLKMNIAREIVSKGLKERDKSQIGLKWPLAKAIIYSKEHQSIKEMEDIIKDELNVKKIELKVSHENDVKVELDTRLTPELEAEGYARELARQVQDFRKKLGLNKKQKVETQVVTDEDFKKILEKNREFLRERTNSKKLEIVTTDKERFKNKMDFEIKDKRGNISIRIITD